MTDEEFVKSIIPSAECKVVESGKYDYDNNGNPVYLILAKDMHEREYVVSYSFNNKYEAWSSVADTFRLKMLSKLENTI